MRRNSVSERIITRWRLLGNFCIARYAGEYSELGRVKMRLDEKLVAGFYISTLRTYVHYVDEIRSRSSV